MEFGEKLQNLRKSRGLTQEELAECLYVSRAAVSKWESGRGYPSIDSIKEIASFFSVTVDELLSGEKILSLAEKENQRSIQKMCNLLFGMADLFALMPVILPLYPNPVDGHVYSVNLFVYGKSAPFPAAVYWILFLGLIGAGILKMVLTQKNVHRGQKSVTGCSVCVSIFAVLFLSITRQVYATIVLFALLTIKGMILLKYARA